VEAQFKAFVEGFHDLIPADLITVFDERELELLIGGIADIDVEDWKKHTDYRGYTETDEVIVNFWKVSGFPRWFCGFRLTVISVYGLGMPNRNLDSCSLLPEPLASLSTVSRIFREAMDPGDSPSKRPVSRDNFPNHIHGLLFRSFARKRRVLT
jgi:hypothetical protein